MPILQPKRSAADDFLDAPDSAPAAPQGQIAAAAPTGVGAPKSAADAFLDAPDTPPEKQGPVRRFLGNLAEQVNPVTAVKGIAQLTSHPIDTYKADARARSGIFENAKQRFSQGDVPGGIAKGVEAFVPFLGPALSKAGDQFESGDIAGGAGASVGMGLSLAAPGALKAVGAPAAVRGIRSGMQSAADRIYRVGTDLTPEQATFSTTEGIAQSPAGLAKAKGIKAEAGRAIGGPVRGAPQTGTVSPGPVVRDLDNLRSDYLPSEQGPIDATQQEFLAGLRSQPGGAVRNMTPAEALDKKVLYQDAAQRAKKNIFEPGSGPHGAGSVSKATAASSLGDQLVAQFPEIKNPNARYGLSSDVISEVQNVVDKNAKRNPFRSIASMSGVVTGIATGHPEAGFLSAAAMELAGNPAARSRLAIVLSKASRVPLSEAQARIAGYLNAVGQSSANAETPTPQGRQ